MLELPVSSDSPPDLSLKKDRCWLFLNLGGTRLHLLVEALGLGWGRGLFLAGGAGLVWVRMKGDWLSTTVLGAVYPLPLFLLIIFLEERVSLTGLVSFSVASLISLEVAGVSSAEFVVEFLLNVAPNLATEMVLELEGCLWQS